MSGSDADATGDAGARKSGSPSESIAVTTGGGLAWWHAAFVGVPVITVVTNLVAGEYQSPLLVAAIIAVIPVAWFAFGRRSFRSRGAALVFGVVLIAAMAVAIAWGPNSGLLQSLVYPFVWTAARTLREAIVANIVVALAAGAGFFLWFGADADAVPPTVTIIGLSLLFSLAFGFWITRIAEWGEQRARLLAELTAAQDQLARAHRDAGGVAERERIAREVHDTIAQSLTGLVMLAQRASATAATANPDLASLRGQLELIETVGVEALGEARAVVADSAAVPLDGGLADAMARLGDRFERETGLRVEVAVDAAMTRELEVVLLRCAQEALANVRKHAGATAVRLVVTRRDGAVRLEVTDDGRGITEAESLRSPGFGLSGMRDRLALVGGTMTVGPAHRSGTELVVRVPVEGEL
ncbi:sensor histidine kinase [Herbiconiux sp. L3-i23]|uniref:sensor histidine kinase n=1 Tax=Herbiconiux sp. L3-i23 TaxID=2905871 RepID=UPI0020530077|nr:sensor histidine kinase [Herbiconiux sp. L3-i23]BDI21386.1 two-component sensor histidine kinase [Herbiconiux sp. L3-i23]